MKLRPIAAVSAVLILSCATVAQAQTSAARPAGASYVAKDTGTQQFYREGLPLGTRGGMVVDHYFPADGDYVMNIGNMAQALWVYNMEFENTVVVTVDGAEVHRTQVGGEADMKAIDQKQDPAVDAINARLKNSFSRRCSIA